MMYEEPIPGGQWPSLVTILSHIIQTMYIYSRKKKFDNILIHYGDASEKDWIYFLPHVVLNMTNEVTSLDQNVHFSK